jgi:CheY-like chemotaxis protein
LSKQTVLIIDDDAGVLDLLREVLSKLPDVALHVAVDGKEAVQRTLAVKPDLILVDIHMPKLDGVTFCKALRSHEDTANIPIIIITAFGTRERLEECMAAGADDLIDKPFDVDDLILRVRTMLNLRAVTDHIERTQKYILALRHARKKTPPA